MQIQGLKKGEKKTEKLERKAQKNAGGVESQETSKTNLASRGVVSWSASLPSTSAELGQRRRVTAAALTRLTFVSPSAEWRRR